MAVAFSLHITWPRRVRARGRATHGLRAGQRVLDLELRVELGLLRSRIVLPGARHLQTTADAMADALVAAHRERDGGDREKKRGEGRGVHHA